MIPIKIKSSDIDLPKEDLIASVQQLSVAEIEAISIEDISSLSNNTLKDILNDAVRNRLAQHLGGTYTSPPKMTVAEIQAAKAG